MPNNITLAQFITIIVAILGLFGGILSWWFSKFIQDSRSDTIHEVKIDALEKKVLTIETKIDKQYQDLNTMADRNFKNLKTEITQVNTDMVKNMGEIKVLIEQKLHK